MIIIKLPFSYSSQISTACLLAKLHDRLARVPSRDNSYRHDPSLQTWTLNLCVQCKLYGTLPLASANSLSSQILHPRPNMTSLQAVGKNYRLKGKEIATSLTSTTNIINNINNKHNNSIINNISVQSLPLLEEISGVSKYHSGHLPSQSAANSTKRSKLLRNLSLPCSTSE
jgi:hypothetical protein